MPRDPPVPAAELEGDLDLALVHMLDGERAQLPVLDDVHAYPVRDPRHGHLRECRERRPVVEGASEGRARLDEERCASSALFRSSMSVLEPNHFTISPSRPRIAIARIRCQRYEFVHCAAKPELVLV